MTHPNDELTHARELSPRRNSSAAADLPGQFESRLVENEDGPGPFGAKGVGEGALAGAAAAVVTALADLGLHANELPLTPERVWRAMQAADEREELP